MPVFTYTAMDAKGQKSAGELSADTRAAAIDQIVKRGFSPLDVQEQTRAVAVVAPVANTANRRVPQAQVDSFTRELANLLNAAVPLSRALGIVIREASHSVAKAQWTAIHDEVVAGTSLADSMGHFPRTFPAVYVAMVRAGETGGFLDLVLTQISEFQSREDELKGKVKAALVYPAVLATLAAAVLIFLLTYFIPRFSVVFKDFGGELPALTRVIVSSSESLTRHGPLIIIAILGVIFGLRHLASSAAGRRTIESVLLKTPLLGHVVSRFALIRFLRMLGTLLGAGVSLIAALRVAKEAIGNQILTDLVGKAIDEVQQGASLSRSLAANHAFFPPSVAEMVAVSEETGRLDKELQRMSVALEADLDRRLRMLVALAEPLLLFVMAGVIGTVVVGMLLPLFQLQDLVK